jgi:hypothetical protein
MPGDSDIDSVLGDWPFKPGVISARLVRAADGRQVMQMRIELGILQMELAGRPDGERPGGEPTYLDWLRKQAAALRAEFVLSEEDLGEIDREFLQFYHRRICCLALREFGRAVADADHTLALMDFVAAHWPEEEWTLSHERYRPFVLFHRTQAAALAELQSAGPEAAIEEIAAGLERIRRIVASLEADAQFEQDELVAMKESLRREFRVGRTLGEQLADAVAAEQYERAARLRDEIDRRRRPRRR